ncbi:M3 family oligoendopeptidase [Butyrivibrio sp. NC3005]|uniref:M3 family oligoendopeptidase n=1 Tax=Butyrivibrio sp. NC3005 TaxID=1280685 RepID=UPI000402079F|nr:M3 family oligoendopeptidase [Butyrivibrio sp. NC3005]
MKFSEMPYKRADIEKIKNQFVELEKEFDNATSGEEQFEVHKKYYELQNEFNTEFNIAYIRHDGDMTDEFYSKESDYYNEVLPVIANLCVHYEQKLATSKYRDYLEKKIGPVAFKNMELAAKSVDEKILPLMQEENKLQDEYNKLLATAKIDWNGETLNLSLMEPYLRNSDRNVRVEAWKKYSQFFADNKEQMDDIYDKLVKNRTLQGTTLGYENYLPLGYARMRRNCYGMEDLKSFREQVKKDFVPFAEKLHEVRRKRLGLDHLHFEDEGVYFKNGNPAPIGTPEQILENGRKMYNELSPETAEFMNFMCENELFDVLGRKTKKTGGYMTYIPRYKSPFIFANFNGTSGDVDVITHECGHAFQGFVVRNDEIIEHTDITMETAETHSMSMEFFTEPWMKMFFGDRSDDYIKMHFEDSCIFIPYGTMVDEFQHIAYSNPGLTPKQRDEVWKDLEREYRPHMDYSGNALYEGGAFWQNKHHIYDSPLYYIDYCIAGTDALQYKAWMDKDYKAAWASYLKLCNLSASDFFNGLIEKVGLKNPFEDGCLKSVVSELEKHILF